MKLVNLLEDEVSPSLARRRTFALKFQQDLLDLSDDWEVELIKVGEQGVALEVDNGKTKWRLNSTVYNDSMRMVNTALGYNIYFYGADDFLDYAHEHKL